MEQNKKTEWSKWDIINYFQDYNESNKLSYGNYTPEKEITAVIVYAQSNYSQPYTETQRSYRISNFSGKACFGGMLGSSLVGDCLDGIDLGVRLDAYNWKIEKCYIEFTPDENILKGVS